ncbi:hypothetical protein ACLOJK_008397 [Asimina triloba]
MTNDLGLFWFGRILAAANLLYFSINLFGFLIPQFLPRAFERYFTERDETRAKMAEDKRMEKSAKTPKTTTSPLQQPSQQQQPTSDDTKKED